MMECLEVYTSMMHKLRKTGVLTGLPDAYARGRIIGDYRRIALYGVDKLIAEKQMDKEKVDGPMTDDIIRLREEISEQPKFLELDEKNGTSLWFWYFLPAKTAEQAIQWTYFGYLVAVKEHDGAAMSMGEC